MKQIKLIVLVFTFLLAGCMDLNNSYYSSIKLISNSGEVLYINSVNWGVTGDSQITSISTKKKKLDPAIDTLNIVKGLEPFLFSFENDSLKLYFNGTIDYYVDEELETIKIVYYKLTNPQYMGLIRKNGYRSVPEYEYPSKRIDGMPLPPEH